MAGQCPKIVQVPEPPQKRITRFFRKARLFLEDYGCGIKTGIRGFDEKETKPSIEAMARESFISKR